MRLRRFCEALSARSARLNRTKTTHSNVFEYKDFCMLMILTVAMVTAPTPATSESRRDPPKPREHTNAASRYDPTSSVTRPYSGRASRIASRRCVPIYALILSCTTSLYTSCTSCRRPSLMFPCALTVRVPEVRVAGSPKDAMTKPGRQINSASTLRMRAVAASWDCRRCDGAPKVMSALASVVMKMCRFLSAVRPNESDPPKA